MTENPMNDAEKIDQFLSDLAQDIHADPPDGLDADTVAFLRDLVRAESEPPVAPSVSKHIWMRALTDAQADSQVNPSLNGHLSKVTILDEEEEHPMTAIPFPTSTRGNATYRNLPFTLAVAGAITILFAGLLLILSLNPRNNATGLSALPETQQTDEANPLIVIFERYIYEVWIAGDFEVLNDIMSSGHHLYNGASEYMGRDSTIEALTSIRYGIANIVIDDFVVDEDSVWAQLRITPEYDVIQTTTIPQQVTSLTSTDDERVIRTNITINFGVDGLIHDTYINFAPLVRITDNEVDSSDAQSTALPPEGTTPTEWVSVDTTVASVHEVIDRFWQSDVFDAQDPNLATLSDLYAPNYTLHLTNNQGMSLGIEPELNILDYLSALHRDVTQAGRVQEFDTVTVLANQTHVMVQFQALIPEGGTINTWDGVILYRFEGTQIVEEWWYGDYEFLDIPNPASEE